MKHIKSKPEQKDTAAVGKKNSSKKSYQKPQVKSVAIGCVMLPTYDGD